MLPNVMAKNPLWTWWQKSAVTQVACWVTFCQEFKTKMWHCDLSQGPFTIVWPPFILTKLPL
jgi:hypothetical protein